MMLYLTGAPSSLAKSKETYQTDPQKSLGGFVSNTPVPNGELNVLFDLLSTYSLEKKRSETIALGLLNQYKENVKDVKISIVRQPDAICGFEVAAVPLRDDYSMETIPNRYALPLAAKFYNADFVRPYADFKITTPACGNEEALILPLNVVIHFGSDCNDEEKTYEYMRDELEPLGYVITKLSDHKYRISATENIVVDESLQVVSSDGFALEFTKNFNNDGITNNLLITELLKSGEGIGLWIKRKFNNYKFSSNEELVKQYREHKILPDVEEFSLQINFEEVQKEEHKSFDDSYNDSYN